MLKRKYSQHFLIKRNTIKKIIKEIKFSKTILEIGPGFGNFTDFFPKKKKIILIELDVKIFKFLIKKYKNKNFLILNKNILKFNFNKFKKITLFSSIPYKITTKILFFLLKNKRKILTQNIIIQKEYYDNKFKNKKSFFYFLINYNYKIKKKIFIKNKNFFPKPKVNSIFLILKIKKKNKFFENFFNKFISKINYIKSDFFFFFKKKKKKTKEVIIFYLFLFKKNLYFKSIFL
ncbi:rRNA adenine N-6-methyltransferase family protein [Candidatus Vidania fulgoroideorum]